MSNALGCIPTPYNPKDFLPEDSHVWKKMEQKVTFPAEYRIPFHGPIKNQGKVGSCTSHALANVKEIIEETQSGEFKAFSTGFIYAFREGKGQSIGGGMNVLKRYGDVLNQEFPYNDDNVYEKLEALGQEVYEKAYPFRITQYYRIDPSMTKIKSALMQVGPVVISLAVYPTFDHLTSEHVALPPEPGNDKVRGYHALAVLGWRKDGTLIIANSWGEKHGDKGYVYLSPDYPIREAWVAVDKILP